MNTPLTNLQSNRTPSATQPKGKTREEYIEMIELYIKSGCKEIAIEMDKTYKIGYFDEKAKPLSEQWLDKFITCHYEMLQLKQEVRKLIQEKDAVLLQGDTGTGKELLAHALHGNKDKRDKDGNIESSTFIEINCAGLPEYLIESELFGHVKGSFTGASSDTPGLFELANGGTLFLDEIGELPILLQAKLLRVLQDKRIRKVGGKDYIEVDFRLVCATKQHLESLVERGTFRDDLYYRISTIELQTLPLVQRQEDIPLIVSSLEAFDGEFPRTFHWDKLATKTQLKGNVRLIQQIVRRFQLFNKLPNI